MYEPLFELELFGESPRNTRMSSLNNDKHAQRL